MDVRKLKKDHEATKKMARERGARVDADVKAQVATAASSLNQAKSEKLREALAKKVSERAREERIQVKREVLPDA